MESGIGSLKGGTPVAIVWDFRGVENSEVFFCGSAIQFLAVARMDLKTNH
jgi:hypothetical protein